MKITKRVVAILLVFCLFIPVLTTAAKSPLPYKENYENGEKLYNEFNRILKVVLDYNINAKTDDNFMERLLVPLFEHNPQLFYDYLNIILDSYDQYSWADTPDIMKSYYSAPSYVGVGLSFKTEDTDYIVDSIVKGSPAEKSGILPGDQIIAVNDLSTKGLDFGAFREEIQKFAGKEVSFTVFRQSTSETFTVSISPSKVRVPPVEYTYLSDDIGYIALKDFMDVRSFADFDKARIEMRDKGIKKLVIDLRNNGGGSLTICTAIIDLFFDKTGEAYLGIQQRLYPKFTIYESTGAGWSFDNVVILVNQHTASAAEAMAGALQQYDKATVIGNQTYGKGLGQSILYFDNATVALSTIKLLLPDGNTYDSVGIIPDIEVDTRYITSPNEELLPIDADNDVIYGETSRNARAVNQHLYCLGYLARTPDDIFNGESVAAMNKFQSDNNLKKTLFATERTLRLLSQKSRVLSVNKQINDAQLLTAYEYLK